MPKINILNLHHGDSQEIIIDKINYNFDQILSAGGGPQGQRGSIGPTGPVGPQGPQGPQGLQGPSGTKWFVQDTEPAIGNIGGNNPFLFPTLGDYWLNINDPNKGIYVFNNNGWTDTGFGFAETSTFQNLNDIPSIEGDNKGIFISGDESETSIKSLILSDKPINNGYYQNNNVIENTNYENAKLKIATKDSRKKIISFARSDFDTVNINAIDSNNNPSIEWDVVTSGNNYYDISFKNPTGNISIKSEKETNISGNNGVSLISNLDDINVITTSQYKGINIKAHSNRGYFKIHSSSLNTPNTWFYANATGIGIGLDDTSFKVTGPDSRKLAVKGNVSISNSTTGHTGSLFVGVPNAPGYNRGSLYVEGYTLLGYPNLTGNPNILDPTGTVYYPQLSITNSFPGNAIEIKTPLSYTGSSGGYMSRTTIGDGFVDGTFLGGGNKISGINSTITQELQVNSIPIQINFGEYPSLTFQHKIFDHSKESKYSPTFGITTYVNNNATDFKDFVSKTVIQTQNFNNKLYIQANGDRHFDPDNKVFIGTNETNQISIHGSQNNQAPQFATTTIGYSSEDYIGYSKEIPNSIATFTDRFLPNDEHSVNKPSHALVVAGTMTIGTTDTISSFVRQADQSEEVSAVSMLKIHRNLGTGFSHEGGNSYPISGPKKNNWPNGLEITSYKPLSGDNSYPNANRSVSIAVGAITDKDGLANKGFLVSDDGRNVSINDNINYDVHLYIKTVNENEIAINTNGTIEGKKFKGMGIIPIRGIIMWSGEKNKWNSNGLSGEPELEGFIICKGGTYGGINIPDLSNMFMEETINNVVYYKLVYIMRIK